MATADQLLELIFSWIEEKEHFADELRILAKELESFRKICNTSECVGSSLTVLGAASMIGAGVATVFTFGAAAPLLNFALTASNIGSTISVVSQILEDFLSCSTMKKVLNIEKKSNEIAKEIQQLFQKLKSEKEVNSLAEPDELEHHVMAEFLRAIARQSGLNVQIINDSILNDMLHHKLQEFPLQMISNMHSRGARRGGSSSTGVGQRSEGHFGDWTGTSDTKGRGTRPESTPQMRTTCLVLQTLVICSVLFGSLSVLRLKTFKLKGMETELCDTVLRHMSTTGFQTALKGGVMVVGGLASMTCALPEMIDNWTKMIKGNHVTEASKSLRDTANGIQKTTQTLKEEINNIKKILQEIEEEENRENKTNKSLSSLKSRNPTTETRKILQEIEEEENNEEETEDPPAVRVGLLNVYSIKTKTSKIQKLITENNLDVFLTTETWLKNETAGEALNEASPPNFRFHQESRKDRKGGGVAIQFSTELQDERINFGSTTTFEYVAAALKHDEWDEDVLFVNLYHPPGRTKIQFYRFIYEFLNLLEEASKRYTSVIVTGDFNIHVNHTDKMRMIIFGVLCIMFGFVQYSQEPTHKSGSILDLVLGRNVDISGVSTRDDKISDHFTVYFSTKPTLP